VIHLVLHADRRQAFGVELVGLAVAVERANAHAGVALHLLVDQRHRQAAFLAEDPVVGAGDELRVDQHARLVVRLGGVHHDEPDVAVDLRGRQAHAIRGVHQRRHFIGERADLVGHVGHRLGNGVQAWIGVTENLELGHAKTVPGNLPRKSPLMLRAPLQ